eukprot:Nk52_evm79s914 gene=Nk52_evmTU79s914
MSGLVRASNTLPGKQLGVVLFRGVACQTRSLGSKSSLQDKTKDEEEIPDKIKEMREAKAKKPLAEQYGFVIEPFPDGVNPNTGEAGGPAGPEPTRYGDWERKGRISDF